MSRDSGDLVDPHPFLTEFGEAGWVEKMLAIQAVALVRRMEAAHAKKLVIGVSGGADSALALLAAARAVARRKVGSVPTRLKTGTSQIVAGHRFFNASAWGATRYLCRVKGF